MIALMTCIGASETKKRQDNCTHSQ